MKVFFFLILSPLLFSFSVFASDMNPSDIKPEDFGSLPREFYELPEMTVLRMEHQKAFSLERFFLPKAGLTFDRIIGDQQKALDNLPPRDLTHGWLLTFLSANVSLTNTGILGVLTGKGTPSFQLLWKRRGLKTKRRVLVPLILPGPELPHGIAINETTTIKDLEKDFEPVVTSLVKTGRIKNPKLLRQNFFQKAMDFQKIIRTMGYDPKKFPLYVQQFILELQVSAGGNVTPFVGVDGIFRLRLEWTPMVKRTPITAPGSFPRKDESLLKKDMSDPDLDNSPMKNFVVRLWENLQIGSGEIFFDKDFPLNLMIVRFGISASGNIFIARSAASATGQITFQYLPPARAQQLKIPLDHEKNLKNIPQGFSDRDETSSDKNSSDVLYIGDIKKTEDLVAAKKMNVDYILEPISDDKNKSVKTELVLYKGSHKKFIEGLRRSLKMTRYFSSRLSKHPSLRWELFRMAPAISVSLGGSVALTTITGNMSIQLAFDRKKDLP
jgi:hypothetical protein